MILQFVTAQSIRKGELAGVDSYTGKIIPARPNDVRVGYALRDIAAGETVKASFLESTEDFDRSRLGTFVK